MNEFAALKLISESGYKVANLVSISLATGHLGS
ncbi:hypothetical protein FRIGORI9N_100017 [Frigoribacterium sp. 9N]|nr:hypothetical protein FRIGORI9N_100017 [Frigoribacterium sp. 9N]